MRSPWERALGERTAGLDAGLRAYFGPIPGGSVGRGDGVFDVVGTPRRWLWPVLAILALDGIVFPVWEHAVPFTVTNRSTARGTVRATRVFHLPAGDAVMTDEIGITSAGLTDRLGARGLIAATFDAEVSEGRLVLRSSRVALRLGPLGALSPRVTLVESTGTECAGGARQHVSVRMALPLIGTLYEYSGSFAYRLERDDRG